MRRVTVFVLAVFALFAALVPASEAVVLFDEDFEPPAYALGSIHTQNGWSGQFGVVNAVSNTVVHNGTQSLHAVQSHRNFSVLLEGPSWYMETWAYVQPFTFNMSAQFYAASALGQAFFIGMRGDGLLTLNTGTQQSQRALGPVALNKWLLWRIEKIPPATLRMTVSGPGVSETFEGPLTTPWAPQYLGVGTGSNAFPDANLAPYFDDIHAATDEPVPTDSKSWGAVKGLYR